MLFRVYGSDACDCFFFFGGGYNFKTKVNKDLEKLFAGSNYLIIFTGKNLHYLQYLSKRGSKKIWLSRRHRSGRASVCLFGL